MRPHRLVLLCRQDPTIAFGTALPFGLNAHQQNAWLYEGGGIELLQELYRQVQHHPFPAGNTGAQMGGWFRNEIKTADDLKGLKMRIPGLGGQVMRSSAWCRSDRRRRDLPALQTGAIDAAEWVGPYDDEKLGFNKVAQFYYYPGWWEGSSAIFLLINKGKWDCAQP